MDKALRNNLKKLPQIGHLLETKELQELSARHSHALVKSCCNDVIAMVRRSIIEKGIEIPDKRELVSAIQERVEEFLAPRMQNVINATGILLHTGLGRSPLTDEFYKRAFERVRGTCSLELNLDTGKRGDRQNNLEELIQFVTGAECCAIVNNNAAAVLLSLNTLANRKETIVSRGQLIEIGGSFRLPEVMRKSGTKLVEVGTTNRTYLKDYEEAITERTRAVLIAHSSNYRVKGFVHEEEVEKVAALCKKRNIFLIHDLGGGVVHDLKKWGLPHEPVVSESIKAGVHVVTFSGDKILGGPQAGIIVGEKTAIRRIRKNAMMRALRPDKLTLALLEETFKIYLSPTEILQHHHVLVRLHEKESDAQNRGRLIYDKISESIISDKISVKLVKSRAQLGSGALPLEDFPSAALQIRVKGMRASQLAKLFRMADPPVVGYTKNESVLLDVKAILEDEIELLSRTIIDTLRRIL